MNGHGISGAEQQRCLEDVSVLELGNGVAAGFCALILARLGARVTKIPTAYDAGVRHESGPEALRANAQALYLDDGKEVLETSDQAAAIADLMPHTDVVIRGSERASGDVGSFREEYDFLRPQQPGRLIYLALTPFGTVGPAASWHGGDLNAQALTGWTSVTGMPDEAPLGIGYGIGGMLHGLHASSAVLAALLASGSGEFVDVAESEALAASISFFSSIYKWAQIPMVRAGHRAPGCAGRYPQTVFPCKDGWVSVICRSDDQWDRFVEMIGSPEWAAEPRYRDFYAMAVDYPDEVDALVAPWFVEHTREEIVTRARELRVPLAPVRGVDEVLDDDIQLEHRGFFKTVRHGTGSVRVPGLPVLWQKSRLPQSAE